MKQHGAPLFLRRGADIRDIHAGGRSGSSLPGRKETE